MKASDNPFPSLLIEEATEPSAPAAGHQRLYIDSTSHHLSRTDENGDEVDLEAGGGDITTDPAWAAKGDLIVATGNNAASVLTVGTNDYVLTADSSQATGLKWAAGGGGGGGDTLVPSRNQSNTAQGSTQNPTCAFAGTPASTSLILVAGHYTGRATSGVPTMTGVTFVEIESYQDASDYIYLWAGTGTASTATVSTATGSNNYYCLSILDIDDPGVTPTKGTTLEGATSSPHRYVAVDGLAAGRLVAVVRAFTNSSLSAYSELSIPSVRAKQPTGCCLHAAFVPSGGSFDVTNIEGSSSNDGVYIIAEIV